MRPTSGFAILQECTKTGRQDWVSIAGPNSTIMTAVSGGPSETYADRATAERDAETFRERNARAVERDRWRPKYKSEPATYTVTEITPQTAAEVIGRARWAKAG